VTFEAPEGGDGGQEETTNMKQGRWRRETGWGILSSKFDKNLYKIKKKLQKNVHTNPGSGPRRDADADVGLLAVGPQEGNHRGEEDVEHRAVPGGGRPVMISLGS